MRPGERFLQVFNEDFGPFLARSRATEYSALFHCYPVPDFADRLMRLRAEPAVVIFAVRHIANRMYESGVPCCLFPEWERKVEALEDSIKRITPLDRLHSPAKYDNLASTLLALTADFLDMLYQKAWDMDSVTRERWLSICNTKPLVIQNSVSYKKVNQTVIKISEFTLITSGGMTGNVEQSYLDSDTEDEMLLKAIRGNIPDVGHKKEFPNPFFQDDLKFLRNVLLRDIRAKVGEAI